MIEHDDFSKVEMRIGEILSVEIVQGADKLLKLSVDLGEERPRQIISGIREYFEDPQTLVGRQCPFVTNLAPRVIRGLESEGMILAGSHETILALLHPHQHVPNGTKLR